MKKILIPLLTSISLTPVMGAAVEETPPVLYKNLQEALSIIVDSAKCRECLSKKDKREKGLGGREKGLGGREKGLGGREKGQLIGDLKSLLECESCKSNSTYEEFISTLGGLSYNITDELERLIERQAQAVLAAYSEHSSKFGIDYRTVDVRQLTEAFHRDAHQIIKELQAIRGAPGSFITEAKAQQIKTRMPDCLDILARIHDFCEDGYNAYLLAESKK